MTITFLPFTGSPVFGWSGLEQGAQIALAPEYLLHTQNIIFEPSHFILLFISPWLIKKVKRSFLRGLGTPEIPGEYASKQVLQAAMAHVCHEARDRISMGTSNMPLDLCVYVCSNNPIATLAIERLLAQSHSDWHLATWLPNQLISVPPGVHILLIDISSLSEWPEIVHKWTEDGHRTILMTAESWASRSVALRALYLGVRGIVCMSADFIQQLLEAIRSVAKGQLFADEEILDEFYNGYRRKRSPSSVPYLSFREEQVIDLLTKGFSNKRIGAVLGITERTAKFHVCNLLRKLQVRTRRELVDRYDQHKSA